MVCIEKQQVSSRIQVIKQNLSQCSEEAKALQEYFQKITAQIVQISNQIDGLELEASNLQREINSIHVPTPDEDDPSSVEMYQQAMRRIQQLQARRQNMLNKAALLREKRSLCQEKKRQVSEKKTMLAGFCRERADLVGRMGSLLLKEAQRLCTEVKGFLSRIEGTRFSGSATEAVQTAEQNAGWYRQAAQIMENLRQGFQALAESLDEGEDRQKVKTLVR